LVFISSSSSCLTLTVFQSSQSANYSDDQLSIVLNYLITPITFPPAAAAKQPKIFQSYVPEYPQLVTPRPILSRRLALPVVKEKKMVKLAPLRMDPTHTFDRFMAVP